MLLFTKRGDCCGLNLNRRRAPRRPGLGSAASYRGSSLAALRQKVVLQLTLSWRHCRELGGAYFSFMSKLSENV